jgi:hypothetical protein
MKKSTNQKHLLITRIALFLFVFILTIPFISFRYINSQRYIQLKASGVHTEGIVTKLHCDDHGRIEYKFSTTKGTFENSDYACMNYKCKTTVINESIDIIYSPSDPNISSCSAILVEESNHVFNYTEFILIYMIAGIAIYRVTKHK